MVLHKENIDFKTHCTHFLGDFTQTHKDKTIKNENSPRVLDYIYLCPSADQQEGHDLLHIQNSRVTNRKKITPVPTNEWCIKIVHSISNHEGMRKGLKTKDRSETIYFGSHWTAGVDRHCENEDLSGQNYEDYEEDSDYEPESDSDEKIEERSNEDED